MILLNFIKKNCTQTSAQFPHWDQRGNTSGNNFSPFSLSGFRWKCLIGLLGSILATSTLVSAEQAVGQQIDQTIHQYLQTLMNKQATEKNWQGLRIVLVNTPLTSTRQLTPCPGKINVSGGSATKFSRQQLTLECPGTKGWPIKVSTDLQLFLPVVISTVVINRGETIRSNQLQTQETDITRLQRGFYHRTSEITNMGAKRRIRANQILSPDLIDQPQLIKRGDKIKIIANRDGISASMPGEALEKGDKGEVIRVKNLSSGKTIEAKVVGVGVVTSTF